MRVQVVIPWRWQRRRERVYSALCATLWHNHGWPITPVDVPTDLFCLAGCRNQGVKMAEDADVVVINDADTFTPPDVLKAAVEHVAAHGGIALPFTEYRALGGMGTYQYIAKGTPVEQCHSEVVPGATSGVYVTTPEAWWAAGGQDERFLGWGYEDAAWRIVVDTLGALTVLPGTVYAADHPFQQKTGDQYTANAALCWRYIVAGKQGPDAIREILAEPGRLHSWHSEQAGR